MKPTLQQVTAETFDSEVLQSDIPVVVMYWAAWCGPCRVMAATLQEVAPTYAGRIKFVYVDCDANGEFTSEQKVRSIPTNVFYRDGKVEDTRIGMRDNDAMTNDIAKTFPEVAP